MKKDTLQISSKCSLSQDACMSALFVTSLRLFFFFGFCTLLCRLSAGLSKRIVEVKDVVFLV